MFRALFRVVLILVVLAAAVAFFMGYRLGDHGVDRPSERAVGTTGTSPAIDTSRAREAGAKVGEKVATGANQAERALETGALTAKIKAKMALDDTVKALDINVDTNGTRCDPDRNGPLCRGTCPRGAAGARNRRRDVGDRPLTVR